MTDQPTQEDPTMNAKLKRIDERGEALAAQYARGRITEAQYTARLMKLVERAAAILDGTGK